MFCPHCGTQNNDSAMFCTGCGTSLQITRSAQPVQSVHPIVPPAFQTQQTNISAEAQQYAYANAQYQNLSEKDFYKAFASKSTNSWVITVIVICFLTAAISISQLVLANWFALIDMVLYLIFGILLIVNKKWYFALPVTIYSCIGTIITIAIAGTPTGFFALAAGIIATVKLKKINDAYKQYKDFGVIPQCAI